MPLDMRLSAPPPVTRKRFFTALLVLNPLLPALRLPKRTPRCAAGGGGLKARRLGKKEGARGRAAWEPARVQRPEDELKGTGKAGRGWWRPARNTR